MVITQAMPVMKSRTRKTKCTFQQGTQGISIKYQYFALILRVTFNQKCKLGSNAQTELQMDYTVFLIHLFPQCFISIMIIGLFYNRLH